MQGEFESGSWRDPRWLPCNVRRQCRGVQSLRALYRRRLWLPIWPGGGAWALLLTTGHPHPELGRSECRPAINWPSNSTLRLLEHMGAREEGDTEPTRSKGEAYDRPAFRQGVAIALEVGTGGQDTPSSRSRLTMAPGCRWRGGPSGLASRVWGGSWDGIAATGRVLGEGLPLTPASGLVRQIPPGIRPSRSRESSLLDNL